MTKIEQTAIVNSIVDGLAAKGLAVVPANLVEPAMALQKAKDLLMKRGKVTPYEIAKFELLDGVKALKTIKNMVADGRIKKHEHFIDRSGKLYITTECINRLNENK
jgi:hypothetical protein